MSAAAIAFSSKGSHNNSSKVAEEAAADIAVTHCNPGSNSITETEATASSACSSYNSSLAPAAAAAADINKGIRSNSYTTPVTVDSTGSSYSSSRVPAAAAVTASIKDILNNSHTAAVTADKTRSNYSSSQVPAAAAAVVRSTGAFSNSRTTAVEAEAGTMADGQTGHSSGTAPEEQIVRATKLVDNQGQPVAGNSNKVVVEVGDRSGGGIGTKGRARQLSERGPSTSTSQSNTT